MTEQIEVVVLGAGFGGLGAVQALQKAPVHITLVDKNDYHTFQPLLYQVASSLLTAKTVGTSITELFEHQENMTFRHTAVTRIDLENRQIHLAEGQPLPYNFLVIALGAKVNYFNVPGAAEHAFPLYTLQDVQRLRQHLIQKFSDSSRNPRLVEEGSLNIVIVGGGPTGVETAGALASLYFHGLNEDYPHLPVDKAQIILVQGGPALLGMFPAKAQLYTREALEEFGVTVRLEQHVTGITPTEVTLQTGEIIKAHTLVWAAGVQANPLAETSGIPVGRGGRIPIRPHLNLKNYPNVFVIGDMAAIKDRESGEILPQLGSVAIQAGKHAGKNIKRLLKGKKLKPFQYLDKGTMATIGYKAAVVQMPHGRLMTGEKAWLAWGAVHLALLKGVGHRAKALAQWGEALATQKRGFN